MLPVIAFIVLQVSLFVPSDSLSVADSAIIDSASLRWSAQDSVTLANAQQLLNQTTGFWQRSLPVVNDIQQLRSAGHYAVPLLFVAIPFLLITLARAFFQRQFSEMIQSVMSANISQQIFRTQTNSLSVFSVLLLLNFCMVMSIFTFMLLQKHFHFFAVHPVTSLLAMNFLFTLFLFIKWLITKTVATLTDFRDVAEEFLFQYFTMLKTIGVSMFPLIAIFVIADEKWFALSFFVAVTVLLAMVMLLLMRGLSTSIKVMYSSVYYFFVYVCVMEVLPVLLLTKLLTKTIH